MNANLLEVSLKAVYAGHKYHLAIQSGMDAWTRGRHDTPGNSALIDRYWDEWRAYTNEAIRLNEMSMTR